MTIIRSLLLGGCRGTETEGPCLKKMWLQLGNSWESSGRVVSSKFTVLSHKLKVSYLQLGT